MFKIKCKFLIVIILSIGTSSQILGQSNNEWKMQPVPINTCWAKEVSPQNTLIEYPRPQMERHSSWENLNGLWYYTITNKDASFPTKYDGQILVPFPLESALSGVKRVLQPTENLWYKRTIQKPILKNGKKTLLHFGAVDWQTTVYINGKEIGKHTGGYTAFSIDVTNALTKSINELVVKVYDPTDQGIGPHGKQVLNPANIYYTSTSGIWQTVWLETVPSAYIQSVIIKPDIDNRTLSATIQAPTGYSVELIAIDNGNKIASVKGKTCASVVLSINNPKLWTPGNPFLYDLKIKLIKRDKTVDEVKSYFGMRKVSIGKDDKDIDRILLNNKPYFNLGILDQGFWPEGLYTAPTDAALKFDIEAAKAMGFNTIRKHIKIEPARWYYHADKIGMLVWQDFVNPNQSLPEGSKSAYETQVKETLEQLYNYPCITTWVIFNEKWGQYDQQRITEWVKKMDSSRLVDGHSGEYLFVNDQLRSPSPNAYVSADMTDVHCYPNPMMSLKLPNKAQVIGEFGGIGTFIPHHQWNTSSAWGYIQEKPAAFQAKYTIMNQHLKILEKQGLSASIYTQPFDVEEEQNGLITYDREIIKIPLDTLRKIHSALNTDMGTIPDFIVKNADLTDPSVVFSNKLQQYIDGKLAPSSLKDLSVMASQMGDKQITKMASNDYITSLKSPYSKDDLLYLLKVTNTVEDSGFSFLQKNTAEINRKLGDNTAETTIMKLIFRSEIEPYLEKPDIDWDKIEKSAIKKYGSLGQERVWANRLIFYYENNDSVNLGKYYKLYFEKVIPFNRSILHINNLTWYVFKNISDTSILNTAVNVAKYNLEKYAGTDPNSIDTYANLLYKVGFKNEAILWEKKAATLSNTREEIKINLDRMTRNEKTWN